ncbi:MAG: DUF4982 domain-containing protein [Cyclobacteriaceae bacterium]
MKPLLTFLPILFSLALQAQNDQRKTIEFNSDWRFILGDDLEYVRPSFDDSPWRQLSLPHDWSIEAEFEENGNGRNAWLPGGVGWYRKSFDLSLNAIGQRVELQFDGVYMHSTLWVNGIMVGKQYDGYTSFYFDITSYVKFGEENNLVVRVDNSDQPNCRWYSGSGIYRNVWLTITNPLHIKTWGTYITTPEVSEKLAAVEVLTTIENRGKAASLEIETTIYDPLGKEVARDLSSAEAKGFMEIDIGQQFSIESPNLWSVATPALYKSLSRVLVDGKVVDTYESTFGIRSLKFDSKKGFFLNGENMKMKGVCLHHDGGPLGAAVPIEIWERRLQKLKDIGCNAIRTAHNPPAPEFLDLCDQMGFLVMDEFVDKWGEKESTEVIDNPTFYNPQAFGDEYFDLEWKKNYAETIRRDRNHPSIVIWSVGNENYRPGDPRQNQGLLEYGSFVRSMDPTRPVISGMERGADMKPSDKVADILESTEYMDLIGMNYGEQWVGTIGEANPSKPFVSTESYTYFNSSPEKRFAMIETSPWLDVEAHDYNMGLFLWSGIQYLGESKKWPRMGSNSGIFDIAGFETDRVGLYQSFWSEEPVISISVYEKEADNFEGLGGWGFPATKKTWNIEAKEKVDLVTYTNCETVKLFVNNELIRTQNLSDFSNKIMKWRDVKYETGSVRAEGYNNGVKVCDVEIKTSGKPTKTVFKPYSQEVRAGEIFQAEIYLTDKKGNIVIEEDMELLFSIDGGEILALANGDMYNPLIFKQKEKQNTFKGRCLVIARVDKGAQNLKLTVTGKGIKTKDFNLVIK